MGLMKFLMIAVNVIFFAFGGTMLGVGIWLAVDSEAYNDLPIEGMNDAMWAAAVYTMIGVGALVFLVGFFGCFGAMRDGKGIGKLMLKLYTASVTVVILAEITIIILTAIFWSSIDDSVRNSMYNDVRTKYDGPDTDSLSTSWDTMQYKWKCCGSYNFTDYQYSQYIISTPGTYVPYTCCVYMDGAKNDDKDNVLDEGECQQEARSYVYNPSETTYKYLNARGCYDELASFFDQNAAIIIGVTCGVLALQILGIIFACCLMKD